MNKQSILLAISFIISGVLGFVFSLKIHHQDPEIIHTKQIETFHYPALFVKQLAEDPRAGEKIFKEFCASCHANPPKIDIPAPRLGDKIQWDLRKKWGIDTLLKITITGVGAMPARGGCFECSDEQLRQAIQYILDHSKEKK